MMIKSSMTYAYRRNARFFKWMWWMPFFLVFMGEAYKQVADMLDPFDAFRVYSISVPNHCEGEDPPIHVLRRSTGYSTGAWASWFEDADHARAPFCPYESQSRTYKPKDDFLISLSLYQYLGDSGCRLPPGRFNPFVTWTFHRPWRNDATVSITSTAPFRVFSKADPECSKKESNQ